MSKENNIVKIGMLILVIVAIYILVMQNPENFSSMYAGQIENPYLEPLSYQLVPNQPNQPNQQNMNMNMNVPFMLNNYNQSNDPNSTLYQQPLLYPTEMYPKIPWYPKTGQPCVEGQCGATSTCSNNMCIPNSTMNTVMNVPVN